MGLSFGLGSNLSLEEAEPVLLKAIELGCTFWDTAVVYKAGVNEKLLGEFIRKHNVRDKIFSKLSTLLRDFFLYLQAY
jgi:aryl-alcohol dehydrogenase-like predicted oxidoreductase